MLRTGLLIAIALFALLAVAPASSPLQVSYVYSDSMEPTIPEDAGYVLVPAGDVDSGDVVTFYSPRREGYVTHRVVAETEEGFVTKGDNNPSTDQAGGAPPVDRAQIVGEVLAVGGEPLTIPHLGTAVSLVRENRLLILLGGAGALLLNYLRSRRATARTRDVLRLRDIVVPLLVGLAVISTVFVVAGASHTEVVYPVAATATGDPAVLTAGESVTRTHRVYTTSPRFAQLVVDVDGMTVVDRNVSRSDGLAFERSTTNVTARIAPAEPGRHRGHISVYAYPPVLPRDSLESLHAISPLLAATVSTLVVYGPAALLYALFVDGGVPLRAPRNRRLRRLLEP